MMHRLPWLASVLVSLTHVLTVLAVPKNITIDDQYGDPVTGLKPNYIPADGWAQGATCGPCLIKPDPAQVYNGTWHDTTHLPGDPSPRIVSVSFNGTAVYAYGIIANQVPAITVTNLTFTLDGTPVGTYLHTPENTTAYEYNVLLYSNTSIPASPSPHNLSIALVGGVNGSALEFDYVIYTTDDSLLPSVSVAPTASSTSKAVVTSTVTASPTSAASTPNSAQRMFASSAAGIILFTAFTAVLMT